MNKRFWFAAPACAFVLGSVIYWDYGRSLTKSAHPLTVTVTDIQRPSRDPATLARVKELSQKMEAALLAPAAPQASVAPPARPSPPPEAEPRAVNGSQFLTQMAKQTTLTDVERKSLTRVFKIAADMQPGIDAEPSDETRAAYQRQLIDSVLLRLKLILKDDQRIAIARESLSDVPRITPDI